MNAIRTNKSITYGIKAILLLSIVLAFIKKRYKNPEIRKIGESSARKAI